MILSSILPTETVDNPCKDVLAYPTQCFMEVFVSIPENALRYGLILATFAGALAAWLAIVCAVLIVVLFVSKKIYKGLLYILSDVFDFKMPKCTHVLLFGANKQKLDKPSDSSQNPSTKSSGLAKVDTKWVKGLFKGLPGFAKPNQDQSQTTQQANESNSAATLSSPPSSPPPKSSLSNRLSKAPKILSPKALTLSSSSSDQQTDSSKTK